MAISDQPYPPASMADALSALQAQGQAVEALIGQAVEVGASGMESQTAIARKLAAAGKTAATRALKGQRSFLDNVGGPAAALAGQQLATQAEIAGLIPGAFPSAPTVPVLPLPALPIIPVPGSPVAPATTPVPVSPSLPVAPSPVPVSPTSPTITQGPIPPQGTIGSAGTAWPSTTFLGDLPGTAPDDFTHLGPVQPYWMDPACPGWSFGSVFNVQQPDGSIKMVAEIKWPVDPRLPPSQGGIPQLGSHASSPFATIGQAPYYSGCGTVPQGGYGTPNGGSGSISQNPSPSPAMPPFIPPANVPVPVPLPTITQGPIPPSNGTITQGPLPSGGSCPAPIVNLTCPACGTISPVTAPTPPPTTPPKAPGECLDVKICDADRLIVNSDGSYAVHLSLSGHPEFATLVSALLSQVAGNEQEAEDWAGSELEPDPAVSNLLADTWG